MEMSPQPTPNLDSDQHDSEMLFGIANGDRECFRRLHDRYENLLFATILKVLNDREDAQEVLQETFFNLWKKAHLFQDVRGRPVTWLASMARNRAIDRLRAKQRHSRTCHALEQERAVTPTHNDSINGRKAAERRDHCRMVRSAVIELSDIQREAIEMAFFQGLSQKEIAAQLGEPLGTVKARIRRGVSRLREIIDPGLLA